MGVLEMSKTLRSARAPVSGVLVAANDALAATPGLINRDPYGAGWLARLKPVRWDQEVKLLVTGDAIAAAFEAYMDRLAPPSN